MIVEFIHLQSGANPDSVPASVVRDLALVYCPVMIGLYAVSLVLLNGYKITRATHLETLRLLEVGAAAAVIVETP